MNASDFREGCRSVGETNSTLEERKGKLHREDKILSSASEMSFSGTGYRGRRSAKVKKIVTSLE